MFQVKISKATMMCIIFESLFTDFGGLDEMMDKSKVHKCICQSFMFSYLWSMGSNLIDSSQSKFEDFVFNQFKNTSELTILPEVNLLNVYLNTENETFEDWKFIVPDFVYNADIPYFELLVPTVDSIRYTYLMQRLVQMNQPVMLTGITGKL